MRKHGLGAGALIEASASRNPLWSRERHFFGAARRLHLERERVQSLSFASLASTPDL
jgi:hypothetical protein